MRTLVLPLVLLHLLYLFAACAATDAPAPVFVDDFVEQALTVHCTVSEEMSGPEYSVGEVATLNDTSFLVVYPQDQRIVFYGPEMNVLRTVTFDSYGPRGVVEPGAATLVGDSIVYIADKSSRLLKRLDLEGRDRGTIRLDFAPEAVQASGESVLVSPLVVGGQPRWLVYDVADGEAKHLRVPAMRITDGLLNALANMSVTAAYPDGRVVVGHRFIVPFAHILSADAPGEAHRVPVPLPAGLRASLDALPEPPFDDSFARRVPTVLIDAAPDTRTGDLLYIVRTGRRVDDHFEKAIIRVDQDLAFRRAYLPGINAVRLAYLAEHSLSIIADEEDRWYICPTP